MVCVYLVSGGFSEPSSKRRNTPPGLLGRELQGPENSLLTGWGHQGPGTSSLDRAAHDRRQGYGGGEFMNGKTLSFTLNIL